MLKEKKKAEKKVVKKRGEETEAKEANGNMGQNGKVKNDKERRAVLKSKQLKTVNNKALESKGRWSFVALFNVVLLVSVLVAMAVCVILYADGDYSVAGVRAAWPRLRHNALELLSIVREIGWKAWAAARPYCLQAADGVSLAFTALKNGCCSALHSLQAVTGDLTPYWDGVRPALREGVAWVVWATGGALEWAWNVDWRWLWGWVLRSWSFLVEQARVVNEELWRNEAVSSLWSRAQPARDAASSLYEDFCSAWFPVIRDEAYGLLGHAKSALYSLAT